MPRSYRVTLAFSLAISTAVTAAAPLLAAAPAASTAPHALAHLAGRWLGEASVVPASGPAEAFQCIVTYRSGADASSMKQTLRCTKGDFKLEATTDLMIEGDKVSGRWIDKVNELGGDVSGVVTKTGFDIQLGGRFFAAGMTVTGDDCAQSVKLVPVRADYIKELSASLRRC
jgi:hypothetical protein